MDIDKIVRQYNLMRIFRPILKFLEILILWIILPFILTILISDISKSELPIILYVLIFGGYISVIFIDERPFDKYTPPAFLTERFFSNYMKKWEMTESEVEEYVRINEEKEKEEQKRKRYLKEEKRLLLWIDKTHISPIIHQLCQMNPDAKEAQEQFLKEIFPANKIKDIFETEFSGSDVNEAILYWSKRDFSDKKMFVNYLYKFTILADGIHNDEWKFMIALMSRLRFSMNFINFFTNRYYALRTEFEDSKFKREDGSSTAEKSDTKLAPYYSILGVDTNASYEEVKKAYHSLALMHHPDLPQNAGRIHECEELMAKFNEAYNKIIKN